MLYYTQHTIGAKLGIFERKKVPWNKSFLDFSIEHEINATDQNQRNCTCFKISMLGKSSENPENWENAFSQFSGR